MNNEKFDKAIAIQYEDMDGMLDINCPIVER